MSQTAKSGAIALTAGCPVLARRVGGIPEIVDDGVNGAVIEAEPSAEQLFHAMSAMAGMGGDRYLTMRGAARGIAVRRFGLARFLDSYERLFSGVVER